MTVFRGGSSISSLGGGGGAHLKKLRRAEGGGKIFGVFRVKNHDFTPKNHIFPILGGGGGGGARNFWGISCEKSRFYAKKIIFFPILGGGGGAPGAPPPPPTESAPGFEAENSINFLGQSILFHNLCYDFDPKKNDMFWKLVNSFKIMK